MCQMVRTTHMTKCPSGKKRITVSEGAGNRQHRNLALEESVWTSLGMARMLSRERSLAREFEVSANATG